MLALAVWLNQGDRRALTLTVLVGLTIFVPTPREWGNFFLFCISAEILVIIAALRLKTAASPLVILACVLLVIAHVMGYYKNGYPSYSPYRAIVPTLETLELLCCVLASAPIASRLRNRD